MLLLFFFTITVAFNLNYLNYLTLAVVVKGRKENLKKNNCNKDIDR